MTNLPLLLLSLLFLPLSLLLLFLFFIVRPHRTTIPIKNRHVFITGGSSGIGLALAIQAASEGARVSILARNRRKLDEAKNTIRLATGVDVAVFSADVREYDAVKSAIEEAGPIDVLVCNQGVFVPQELETQDVEEFKFMIDVNVIGTFHLIKAALPAMKNRAGRGPASIAIISSQAGQVGVYGYTAYSASKFALRGMAEALQQEVIAQDIHLSLIFPPDTETPGLEEECKRRPELTSIIAASSGTMKPDKVAKIALRGIKSANFIVPCNSEGLLLSIATAGLSPQRSFLMAFIEVAGLLVLHAEYEVLLVHLPSPNFYNHLFCILENPKRAMVFMWNFDTSFGHSFVETPIRYISHDLNHSIFYIFHGISNVMQNEYANFSHSDRQISECNTVKSKYTDVVLS